MKCIFIEQKPQIAFVETTIKNILRCDMIWHNLSAHNLQLASNLLTILQNFHPKNASLIILQIVLNGIWCIVRNGNKPKCNEERYVFKLSLKCTKICKFLLFKCNSWWIWYLFSNVTRPSFRQSNTLKCRLASDNFMNWAIRSCHYYQALI